MYKIIIASILLIAFIGCSKTSNPVTTPAASLTMAGIFVSTSTDTLSGSLEIVQGNDTAIVSQLWQSMFVYVPTGCEVIVYMPLKNQITVLTLSAQPGQKLYF